MDGLSQKSPPSTDARLPGGKSSGTIFAKSSAWALPSQHSREPRNLTQHRRVALAVNGDGWPVPRLLECYYEARGAFAIAALLGRKARLV
eukprot:scaffold35212_cov69-Phaeocystis_antarctica.AAC.13